MREIGSNRKYCDKGYQAACCTTDVSSMKLYDQCAWTETPECGMGSCNHDTVAFSSWGSGEAECKAQSPTVPDILKAKYCCEQPDKKAQWSDCDWSFDRNFYQGLEGQKKKSVSCNSDCPSDQYRLALDRTSCKSGTSRGWCCKAEYKTETKRASEDDLFFEKSLKG